MIARKRTSERFTGKTVMTQAKADKRALPEENQLADFSRSCCFEGVDRVVRRDVMSSVGGGVNTGCLCEG
jgi:hypothetical protein